LVSEALCGEDISIQSVAFPNQQRIMNQHIITRRAFALSCIAITTALGTAASAQDMPCPG
jgi:hypothetical protein